MGDILDTGKKKRKRKRKRRPRNKGMSPALSRMGINALRVTEQDLRSYDPSPFDIQIADVMCRGIVSYKEIGETLDVHPSTVSRRVASSPVTSAWIYGQVRARMPHNLGLVDASVMGQAIQGNIQAAALIYKVHDQIVQRSLHIHANADLDFNPDDLTTEQLKQMVSNKNGGETIDATYSIKEHDESTTSAPDSPAGDGRTDDGGRDCPPGEAEPSGQSDGS